MIEARRVFFEAGGLRVVRAALATVTEQPADLARPGGTSTWVPAQGHHAKGILDGTVGGHGVAVDVSRHALAATARRHRRLAAVGADAGRACPSAATSSMSF